MENDGKPRSQKRRKFRDLFSGRQEPDSTESTTEEEIMSMVEEGHEKGVLQESEARMISNIFEFDDKDAKDIMTHRKNIVAVDASMTLKEVLAFVNEKGYSRYPVYMENIDNITGVIHIKDLLNYVCREGLMNREIRQIRGLVRRIAFIPETRHIDDLFRRMQAMKIHMVAVIDEYGQTAGLVTMEDILEEIVGNIMDEHDAEENEIIQQKDGSFLIDGEMETDDVCEELGIDESLMGDFDTLNGFLIAEINRIPNDGEVFTVHALGYDFDVLQVENKMIKAVRASRAPDSDKVETDDAGQPE
jgi:putative hemolysin